jgi:aspartate aminotransferase
MKSMPFALSKIEHELKQSPIRKIAALLAESKQHKDIISFGGGAPSLEPPKEVVSAMVKALQETPFRACSYGATKGSSKLRKLIAADLKTKGVNINFEQINMTVGATEGIFLALETLVNPKDEVILADPTYVGYQGTSVMDRAKIKRIPVKWKDNFQLTPEAVDKVAGAKTKALILLSPDNPTGRIISKENLKGIAEIAEKKNFWIIADETYQDIVYKGKHNYVYKHAPKRTITVNTFSKSASIPGLRLGYMYGPRDVIDTTLKFDQYVSLCPNTLSQIGARAFYKVKNSYIKNTVLPTYKERMKVMGELIEEHIPNCGFTKPDGAFYYFVDLSKHIKDDEKFANDLLQETKVVVIPGKFFGNNGKKHIRLTFVSEPIERIEQGIKKIGEFLK